MFISLPKVKILILFFLYFWGFTEVLAQAALKNSKDNILTKWSENGFGRLQFVEFYDTTGTRLIRSLNVDSLNPYHNISHKMFKKPGFIFEYYALPKVINKKDDPWDFSSYPIKPAYYRLSQSGGATDFPRKFFALSFDLFVYSATDSLLSMHSTYYVYNNKGQLVQEFKHLKKRKPPKFVCISNDGSYLCANYFPDENNVQYIEIYDMATKRSLGFFDFPPEVDHEVSPHPVSDNKFMVALEFQNVIEWYQVLQVFDIKNGKKYEERFPWSVYVKPEKEGIKIVNKDKSATYKSYLDFKYSNIKKQ